MAQERSGNSNSRLNTLEIIRKERPPENGVVIFHVEGSGLVELSYYQARENIVDRQFVYTPSEKTLQQAPKEVTTETLNKEQIKVLEKETIGKINEKRIENGLEESQKLRRDKNNDGAALLGSYYNAHSDENLTHSVPTLNLLETPIEQLKTVRINRNITANDLEAIGSEAKEGYVANSNTRGAVVYHMRHANSDPNREHDPSRSGGYCEVAVRGYGLTAESVVEALMASPYHREAILNEDFKFAGITAIQGEDGRTTICVVLDENLNPNAERIESKGRFFSTCDILLPAVMGGYRQPTPPTGDQI